MIPSIPNVDEAIKVWRQMIVRQTRLPSDRVLNGMSIRGVDLSKRLTSLITASIDVKDCIIVFTMHNRYDETDISQETELGLESVVNLEMKLTIYGDNSLDVASKLKARVESQKCRYDLYASGIHMQNISSIEEVNEFVNETAWHRCDMSIDFEVRLETEQIDDFDDFESVSLMVETQDFTTMLDLDGEIVSTVFVSDYVLIEEPFVVVI